MIFWISLFVFVTLLTLAIWNTRKHRYDDVTFAFQAFSVIAGIIVGIMACIIVFSHIDADAKIAKYNARYETLTYQYENDIYDNDNDLGKRELIADIQEWNEDLAYSKEIQDDFWQGIFYPNIYDQFEFIELGGAS